MSPRPQLRRYLRTLWSRANYIRWRALQRCWDLSGPIAEAVGPIAQIDGVKVYVDPRFGRVVRDDLLRGTYERAEIEVVNARLQSTDTVMELGAGIGIVSTLCAKRVGSDRVFAYEANPALERHIRRTYSLNHVAPTLEMCLVGDQAGTSPFWIGAIFWESSTRMPRNGTRVSVPAKAFNREVQRLNPSFLIIDIEGAERELCAYAHFHNVKKVLFEVHEYLIGTDGVEFIRSQMTRAGFRPTVAGSPAHVLYFERD